MPKSEKFSEPGKARPGRPPSARKRRSILEAATRLFTHNGFEATSVDDIAREAGVLKQTVYSHFGCKEDLFGVAISTKCRSSGIAKEEIDPDVAPEQVLPVLARQFIELINSDEAISVTAICCVNWEMHPELGRMYFERGPLVTVEAVADYLEAQNRAGRLRTDNAEHAAWQFLCMLKAESQMRAQFHLDPIGDKAQRDYEASCVAMFLRAYAPA